MGVKSYKTKKGTRWRVDEWLVLPDGSRERLRMRDIPTRELAVAMIAKARTEAFEGRYFDRKEEPALTLKQLWETYEPATKQHNRSSRADTNRVKHLLKHLGSRKVAQLTIADVDRFRAKRFTEKTKWKRKPSPATIDREVALLKRMCSYAAQAKLIPNNPVAGTPMLNVPNARDVVVSEADFAKLYEVAEPELKPILLTAYDTGMRKMEVLGLRWDQVDLKQRSINLRARDTKSASPRLVVMTARVIEELKTLPRHIRSPYVFVNPKNGQPWHTIRKSFLRACAAAELEGVWFHDLRRSFVTNARRRGVPESVVMKMSGHKTRSVFDRYNIVSDDDLRDAISRIETGRQLELERDKDEADDA